MKKNERLQAIVMVLRQREKMSARDLADYFEVSMRTIYRDIDALSQMNVPIISYEGLHGGYQIDESYFMPTIRLSNNEILILMLLLKVSKKLSIPDFNDEINLLELKLKNACQGSQSQFEDTMKRITVDIQYINNNTQTSGVFESILRALSNNTMMNIKYFTPLKNDLSERKISPMHLFYNEGCWYLDAFCHLRMLKRTFRLDRIKDIEVLSEHIDLDILKKYTEKALDDPKFLLEFEIDRNLYSLIKDDTPMQDANINFIKDNKYYITIETNRIAYFETLAIRNIKQVTIIKPEFFINQLKEKIFEGIKKYKQNTDNLVS